MSEATKKEKLTSLQPLRFFAFLGIFLLHVGAPVDWGTLGVSTFFVLSGFLMMYSYCDKELPLMPHRALGFSIGKIRKLYVLHIITMLCACVRPIVFMMQNPGYKPTALILKVIYNVFLVQTWIPIVDVNVSLNGVAWYLSVCLFLYFMFPYVKWIIKKLDKRAVLIAVAIVVYILMYAGAVLTLDKIGLDGQLFTWATYCFPVYRLGDFFIGAVAGYIYLNSPRHELNAIAATGIEAMSIVLCIAYYVWVKSGHNNFYVRAISENYTLGYIIFAVILVVVFARGQGYITRGLNNKLFVFLGDLSAYTFLIHYVVTQNLKVELINRGYVYTGVRQWVIILIELLITIAIAWCYRALESKIRNR